MKGFRGARFKSFPTREEADAFVRAGSIGNGNSSSTTAPDANSSVPIKEETSNGNNRKRKLEPPREPKHWLIRVYFDGGSRGNPGIGGCGAEVVVFENTTTTGTNSNKSADNTPITTSSATATAKKPVITKVLQERKKVHIRKYLGTNATNNQAEYQGLLAGVHQARQEIIRLMTETTGHFLWIVTLEIRGDSELIIRQLQGEYKCRHPQLLVLHKQVKECVDELMHRDNLRLHVTYDHVYREHNSKADGQTDESARSVPLS